MTDMEELRNRYDGVARCTGCSNNETSVTHVCFVKPSTFDPAVLALCDEVEALRAQVAAAPEVLREWPKTVDEAPGEWVLVTRGIPISREFGTADGRVYFVSWNNETSDADVMDPGEFFVRLP